MKKNVFRCNYREAQELKENLEPKEETKEELEEEPMQDAKEEKNASNNEQEASVPVKETRKKNKRVNLDD